MTSMAHRPANPGTIRAIGLAFTVIGGVISGAMFLPEYQSVIWLQKSQEQQFQSLVRGELRAGLSERAIYGTLEMCFAVSRSVHALLAPTDSRLSAAQGCSDYAQRVLGKMPYLGFAHLVEAQAQATLGNAGAMNAALAASVLGAPNEGWLAERRLQLAIEEFNALDQAGAAALRADIGVLFLSPAHVEGLAQTYLRSPQMRDLLTAVAEEQPATVQRRFLFLVRDMSEGASQ